MKKAKAKAQVAEMKEKPVERPASAQPPQPAVEKKDETKGKSEKKVNSSTVEEKKDENVPKHTEQKEAANEADHKAYCDEEMAKTKAKKDELSSDISSLSAKIDKDSALVGSEHFSEHGLF